MSDCGVSAYGDDISVVDSVASLFEEERKEEENKKKLDTGEDDPNEKYENIATTLSNQDKNELYNTFRYSLFQDISNDKMYVLKIKKSNVS